MPFKDHIQASAVAGLLGTLVIGAGAQSAHQWTTDQADLQARELRAAIQRGEVEELSEKTELAPPSAVPRLALAAPGVSDDFIVFGYAQTYGGGGATYTDHYRWNALTHVGSTFISFDSTGNTTNPGTWTGRDAQLRPGGGAQAAGTKVIMVILNSGFSVSVINTVMASPTARNTLIADIVSLLQNDGYSHGVSFDFEPFSWNSTATAGMTTFFADLRTALDNAGLTEHEISVYADPSPGSTQWNLPGMTPNIDYYLYSCYDFASGNTPSAISRWDRDGGSFDAVDAINDFYIQGGVPPNKIVAVLSSYARRWSGTTSYGVAGSSPTAQGFTDGLYDTTLNTQFGGPYLDHYVDDDQVGWHTYSNGATNYVRTWESREALEAEIQSVVSIQDPNGATSGSHGGSRLGGVGFWSLLWMAETTSNEVGGGSVTKTRMYPHIFQLCEEFLSAPGDRDFTITGFESLDFRWRDPNESPDTQNANGATARSLVTSPAGAGAPPSTTNALACNFNFAAASPQVAFLHYEILADGDSPNIPDLNNAAGVVDSTTAISAYVHAAAAYPGLMVRMVVLDADGEMEKSDPFPIAAGWQRITWDLTDGTQINGQITGEPVANGDGVLDTAGGGARDIAFIGFRIEGSGALSTGTVTFDEVEYRHSNPGGRNYVINELRYDGSAGEFIEIHGPAGAFPAGLQVRVFNSANGSVAATYALSGSIPDEGGGFGHWVIGDPGVPNVDSTAGFSAAADDIADLDPTGVQIYGTSTGCVYDSVVYEAYGGLDDLVLPSTLGVGSEGYPWSGRVGPGTDASGTAHTIGRLPDGIDTDFNTADFSLQVATPGTANGSSLALPATFDFNTAPGEAFQTFQTFGVGPSGVGASPSGGNVHRCADTSGGGVMTFMGDATLGEGTGYDVRGEIYIPGSGAPSQAVAVGFCGTQGSTFFSSSRDANSYEDGYWLLYENTGSNIDDGAPAATGAFRFFQASNDNQDQTPVVDLDPAIPAAMVGVNPTIGGWATFRLTINPAGSPGKQILARINGIDVFRGDIPAGGRTHGSVMVGFREAGGGVSAAEGTWVDNIQIRNDPGSIDIGETPIPVGLAIRGGS